MSHCVDTRVENTKCASNDISLIDKYFDQNNKLAICPFAIYLFHQEELDRSFSTTSPYIVVKYSGDINATNMSQHLSIDVHSTRLVLAWEVLDDIARLAFSILGRFMPTPDNTCDVFVPTCEKNSVPSATRGVKKYASMVLDARERVLQSKLKKELEEIDGSTNNYPYDNSIGEMNGCISASGMCTNRAGRQPRKVLKEDVEFMDAEMIPETTPAFQIRICVHGVDVIIPCGPVWMPQQVKGLNRHNSGYSFGDSPRVESEWMGSKVIDFIGSPSTQITSNGSDSSAMIGCDESTYPFRSTLESMPNCVTLRAALNVNLVGTRFRSVPKYGPDVHFLMTKIVDAIDSPINVVTVDDAEENPKFLITEENVELRSFSEDELPTSMSLSPLDDSGRVPELKLSPVEALKCSTRSTVHQNHRRYKNVTKLLEFAPSSLQHIFPCMWHTSIDLSQVETQFCYSVFIFSLFGLHPFSFLIFIVIFITSPYLQLKFLFALSLLFSLAL